MPSVIVVVSVILDGILRRALDGKKKKRTNMEAERIT
jgi:hypothetical protein